MRAPVFAKKMERTREQLLNEIVNKNYPKELSSQNLSDDLVSLAPSLYHANEFSRLINSEDSSSSYEAFTLTIKANDLTLKTTVSSNLSVEEFVNTRLKPKIANATEEWALNLAGNWMEPQKSLQSYKKQLQNSRVNSEKKKDNYS